MDGDGDAQAGHYEGRMHRTLLARREHLSPSTPSSRQSPQQGESAMLRADGMGAKLAPRGSSAAASCKCP
eukprot:11091972-Alexandrium_andersonii.AAC.1